MGTNLIPSVDSDTKQLDDDVRARIAANLADPTTPEGDALADVVAPFAAIDPATKLLPAPVMTALDAHNDTRYSKLTAWMEARTATADERPPAVDIPTIVWSSSDVTALTSPAIVRPAACNTGSQVTNWDGATDPVFRYEPGVFMTDAGGNADYALYGSVKPGGDAQAARWPLAISFVTQPTNSIVEIAFYSRETNNGIRVEVNGRFTSEALSYTPSPSNAGKVTLSFPTAAARTIRIWAFGTLGIAQVRIPTGQALTRPTAPKRLTALLGDSYLNGAGSSFPYAATVDQTTYGLRFGRYIGGDSFMFAGIGGTGISAGSSGTPANNYATRAAVINARAPQVLIINASINDGTAAGSLQASTTALLNQFAAVPEVYVLGGIKAGYEANYAAVRAATVAAGRTYLDLGGVLFGSGKLGSPKGDGTNDFWLAEDGAHPTADAHVAIARVAFKAYARARLSA